MNFVDHINFFLEKWQTPITLTIFLLTYLWVAIGQGKRIQLDRTGFALLGAFAMLTFGCISFDEAVACIDFRTLALVFTLMLISSNLHYSGFYHVLGKYLSKFLNRPSLFLFMVMMLTAIGSSLFNNTIIALAFAPMLTGVLVQRGLNPVPFMMGICMTNNGCLTIVGNPQNVFVGQLGKIDFLGYTMYAFTPVMLSALACYAICLFIGRKHIYLEKCPNRELPKQEINHVPYTKDITRVLLVFLLLLVLFIFTDWDRGMISLSVAGVLLCSPTLPSREILSRVDWQTILLFMGLFVVVGTFNLNGLGVDLTNYMTSKGLDINDPVTMALSSTILSNSINNTAAVMLLGQVADLAGNWKTAYALALSNALTGNLILIGSLSNMVIIRVVEQAGEQITFKGFFKYGLPCTLVSVLILVAWLSVT